MGKVSGVQSVIHVASQVEGEANVRFFVESVRMLRDYQVNEGGLAKLRMSGMVPLGTAEDGGRSPRPRSTTPTGTRPPPNLPSARN